MMNVQKSKYGLTSVRLAGLGLAAVISLGGVARGATVFQDNFNNGVVADSSGVPATGTGFWDNVVNTPTESGGLLNLTATVATAGKTPQTWLACHPKTDGTFNFFNNQETYTVQFGPAPAITGTTTVNSVDTTYANIFNLAVLTADAKNPSSGMSPWYADDALNLTLAQNGTVLLTRKINDSEDSAAKNLTNLISVNIGSNLAAAMTGVSLTLNATSYDLQIFVPVGTGIASDGVINSSDTSYGTLHGALGINESDWGNTYNGITKTYASDGNGNSGVFLGVQRAFGNPGGSNPDPVGSYTTATVDSLTVSTIPEPASLALLGLGSLLIFAPRRRA